MLLLIVQFTGRFITQVSGSRYGFLCIQLTKRHCFSLSLIFTLFSETKEFAAFLIPKLRQQGLLTASKV